MSETPGLLCESDGAVRTLRLDSPQRLNALDLGMLEGLAAEVTAAPAAHRVIVLRGEGRAFSSGIDLGGSDELGESGGGGVTIDAAERLVRAMLECPIPIVSLVHGPCAGVSVPIALAADLVLATESAYFQLAFARIGLMPDGGATALVTAAVGRAIAMRMVLTAERLGARDAASAGLVARVVPDDGADAALADLIASFTAGPAGAFREAKAAINAASLTTLDAAFPRERAGQLGLLASADFREGVTAFREKRAPIFRDPA